MEIIIFALIGTKVVQQIFYNLYLWQLKEYRIDRFLEHINRVYSNKFFALLELTIFSPIRFPQKSIKAIFIFLLNLFLNFLFFLSHNILIIFTTLFLTPLIFGFSLFLLQPFEKTLRIIIYYLASRKIKNFQKKYRLTVIGITGSYGKTTTKLFVDQILSSKFKTLATPKSINTPLGISLFILKQLKPEIQFLIVEMGAYKVGEIKELAQIIHPQIGIITGISNQHLALFGSCKNIIKAKSELIEELPKNGIVIVNKQSRYQPNLKLAKTKKIFFYPNKTINQLNVSIPDFLKINLQPALILGKYFGITDQEIKKTIKNIKPPPKTMTIKKGIDGITIIDDSYNSNFEGVLAALDYLQKFKGKKIVVMPCLIELGKESEFVHQKIGRKLAETIDLAIITTTDYFSALKKGGGESEKIISLPNPNKVIDFLRPIVNENSIILLEGRVHQKIIEGLSFESEDSPYLKKPVVISLSPNLEKDDIKLVKKILLQPQLYQKNNYLKQLEEKIKTRFGFKYVFLTNAGRSAFFLLLKALNFPKDSQVAIQGFTCNAAINPILWNDLKPLYIDIDDSWNLDVNDLERKINPKIKMVVIQHSFGFPAKIEMVKKICQKLHLFLVEDLALSLGAKYKGKYCGLYGDAAYLSFGRDKVISSVFGGALVTNNKNLAEKINYLYQKLPYPSIFWTYQQLIHPLITYNLLPFYYFKITRFLIWSFQKLGLLSKAVIPPENRGKQPTIFPKKLPNQLAALALNQLEKLERFNQHRKRIAQIYQQKLSLDQKINPNSEPIYLRYNILSNNAQKIIKTLKKEGIYLGDWYTKPIDPKNTDLKKFNYQKGICPYAEKIIGKVINLPTHINISENEAKRIVEMIIKIYKN